MSCAFSDRRRRRQESNLQSPLEGVIMPEHNVHRCLTCGGDITPEQDEETVPGSTIRYMHAAYQDCADALARPSPKSQALRRDRVVQRHGHKTNLPGLDEMEKW